MQNTLDLALARARQNGATRIDCLTLKIGGLSGVMPEALEFAFEVLIRGTMAEDARLEIETIPVVCYCQNCDRSFQPEEYIFDCPQCQQISSDIVTGRELELASVVVSSEFEVSS